MNNVKNNSFIKDIIITFSGQIFVLLSNFLINKMVAIFVGVNEFGVFNIAKRSATVIGFFILLELGISIPRYYSLYLKNNPKKAYEYYQLGIYILLIMSVFISAIIFFNQGLVAFYIFGSKDFSKYIIPLLVYSIGIAANTFIFSAYRGGERFYTYTVIQLLTQIINVIIVYIVKKNGIEDMLMAWGSSNILLSMIFMYIFTYLNSEFKTIKIDNLYNKLKELLIYGIPRIPGEVIQFSYYLIPLMIINQRFGKLSAGFFAASTGILQAFLPLFSYVGIVLLPKVSKALMEKKMELVKKQVKYLSILYLVFSVVVVFFGVIFARQIMQILYSNEYTEQLNIAKILLITLIPRAQFLLLRNPIDAISVRPVNTISLCLSFCIMILIMIFSDSVTFIAWSFVISDLILAVLSLIFWSFMVNRKSREENE